MIAIFMVIPVLPIGLSIVSLNKYSGIDRLLRLYVSILIGCVTSAIILFGWHCLKKQKKTGAIIVSVLICVMITGSSYFNYVNAAIQQSLNQMIVTQKTTYHHLVTMADNQINEVEQLRGMRIGLLNLNDKKAVSQIEAYLAENNLYDLNEISRYDSPVEMVFDLYNSNLEAMVIGSNYESLFLERTGFENIGNETQVLDTIELETEQPVNISTAPITENPFSILLIGIDTLEGIEDEGLADSLILATFNPQNLSATMTSIPRDSYVPIPCFNDALDKITHAHNGGTTCVVEAVENMFDLDISYYMKVNFSGVIELVDEIGGIEVDVPQAFEEQNSRRQFGEHMIRVEEGLQRLDGEQALALTRHRKTLLNGDLGRANNQQLVLEGILNQVLQEVDTINEFLSLLDVLGQNIETNLSVDDMTSLFQFILELIPTFRTGDPLDYIHLMSMVLSGEVKSVMTHYYSFPLSVILPYDGAIADAKELMLINLERQEPSFKFDFSFNGLGENQTIWVKGFYNEIFDQFLTPEDVSPPGLEEIPPTINFETPEPEIVYPEPENWEPEILEPEPSQQELEVPDWEPADSEPELEEETSGWE